MPPQRAPLASLLFSLAVIGCRSDSKSSAPETTAATPGTSAAPLGRPVNTGWRDSIAGPVLLLSVPENSAAALVVFPSMDDSTLVNNPLSPDRFRGITFDLFDRAGSHGVVRLGSQTQLPQGEGCLTWPAAMLGQAVAGSWRAGLTRGAAAPIPLDSLEGFASQDSVQITTELARLASALPPSNDQSFQGLPFAVRKAYRSKAGRRILIGDIVRTINEEANPRAERTLLVAERSPADTSRYATVFHSRAAGSEEVVRTSELLAAVKFAKDGREALIVSFDYENGSRVALIERVAPLSWKITWRSAYTGC